MQNDNPRNSAQLIVEAHNLNIQKKIEKFESMDETCKHPSTCSIVVTEPDDEKDRNAKRLSIASASSAESAHSDNVHEAEAVNNKETHGTSTFYVVWD